MKTITIGIPAHNEGQNIRNMLMSVSAQATAPFSLERIVVFCDGCSDDTEAIARDAARTDGRIEVISDGERKGKRGRMNQLFRMNTSDIVMCLDADLVIMPGTVEKMARTLAAEPRVSLVSANEHPVEPRGFLARAVVNCARMWDEVRLPVNGGDYIQNVRGGTLALTREFAASIEIPPQIFNDGGYLYIMSQRADGFRFSHDAIVLYNAVSTLHDYWLLSARATGTERDNLIKQFGSGTVMRLYAMPSRYKLLGLARSFIHHPFLTPFSLALNVLVRLFPIADSQLKSGRWQVVKSSKVAIAMPPAHQHLAVPRPIVSFGHACTRFFAALRTAIF